MIPELTPEARRKLDAYLDAVDDILRKQGRGREERSAVIDGLEDQVNDMLAKRTPLGESSQTRIDAVLHELEPPEAYIRQSVDLPASDAPSVTPTAPANEARQCGYGLAGLAWAAWFALSTILLPLTLLLGRMQRTVHVGNTPPSETGWNILALVLWGMLLISLPGLLAPVTTTGLGIVSLGRIRAAPRRFIGWGLAVFDTLIFPSLLCAMLIGQALAAALFLGIHTIRMLSGKHNLFAPNWRWADGMAELLIVQPIGLVLGTIITAWIVMRIVRRINRSRPAPITMGRDDQPLASAP